MVEEIRVFVNKNFLSVHTKEIKSRAKNYLKLIEKKKAFADENYLKYLQTMASKN